MAVLRNNKDTNNNNEAAPSSQPGALIQTLPDGSPLPEEMMVILYSIHGSPNNSVQEEFVEWCFRFYYHQKYHGSLGEASVEDFCKALYNEHFEHWAAVQGDDDAVYWPVQENNNAAGAA